MRYYKSIEDSQINMSAKVRTPKFTGDGFDIVPRETKGDKVVFWVLVLCAIPAVYFLFH